MPTKYYYNIDKKNNGPVTKEELTELAAKKIINANTPVIEVGGKAWSRWGSISGESNNTPSENASHKTPVESAASPRKVTPMKVVSSPIITTNRTSVATSGNEAVSFYEKIHSIYRKIDLALESKKTGECNDENLESFKKRFSKTGAIVGVASLACFLSLGIFNGMYKNIPLFAVLVVVGCFAQYICYHAYNAMTPLLYGSRIKVSSMGALKVLALGLTIPLISRLGDILGIMTQGGRFKVGEYIAMILPPLMGISLCAGIGYVLYNAKRFFVAVEPQSVSPGQDIVNIGRVVIRATFSVLQLFVPILMVLAAVLIAAKGNMEIKYAETLSDNITILKTSIRSMPSLDIFFISIDWATFPVYSLIACYLLSLVSDLLESILSMGNRNK